MIIESLEFESDFFDRVDGFHKKYGLLTFSEIKRFKSEIEQLLRSMQYFDPNTVVYISADSNGRVYAYSSPVVPGYSGWERLPYKENHIYHIVSLCCIYEVEDVEPVMHHVGGYNAFPTWNIGVKLVPVFQLKQEMCRIVKQVVQQHGFDRKFFSELDEYLKYESERTTLY